MKPKQRWLIIGGLLFATLAASYMVDDEPGPVEGATRKGASAKTVASPGTQANRHANARAGGKPIEVAAAPLSFPEPLAAKASEDDDEAVDPFRNKSWFVAPPPPPQVKPSAPPIPFQYLGKLVEEGDTLVFLSHQGKNLIVKAGDIVDGIYTVVKISGAQMTVLYQPLKETQAFSIGADEEAENRARRTFTSLSQ